MSGLSCQTFAQSLVILVTLGLQVIEGRKTPKSRCISKPSILQTTKAKTSKLGSQLVIALTKLVQSLEFLPMLVRKKKRVEK